MVQMVQNFFNFTANTFFWLSYIPFYHRLFPVFDTAANATTTKNNSSKDNNSNSNKFSYRFSLESLDQSLPSSSSRSLKKTPEPFELSYERFGNLLRAFADVFDAIRRFVSFRTRSQLT